MIAQNAIYTLLRKHSHDDAIRKYTSETAGYGTGYLLEHDYEDLSWSIFDKYSSVACSRGQVHKCAQF